jgi:mono/diheme cytochrome c family protein
MSDREPGTGNREGAPRSAALAWRALGLAGALSLVVLAACDRGPLAERAERRQQALGAGRLPADVKPVPEAPSRYGVGRPATPEQIRVWDVDIDPDGTGLPQGRGTHADGLRVYALKCAACHGGAGEGQVGPPPLGVPAAPRLIGREPREGFGFGQDPKLVKTVGNYWPYATTVFDYVRRTMPITAPGSLSNSEVYAVVAFILAENEIIEKTAVLDSLSLPLVKMPARDKFVADDRKGGSGFK